MEGNENPAALAIPLRDLCVRITKGTTPTTLGRAFVECGINFVKSESITPDGRIDTTCFAAIDADTHAALARSILEEGDVLFSMAGVYLGKTAVVPKAILPANTNQAVGIIRVDPSKADPRFIHYALSAPATREYVGRSVAQSAQPNFNLGDIGSLPIPKWNLSQQRRIAHILGTLDDKIELNRRMNETLEAMARALFKSWFVDFDPVRAKSEGRQPTGMDAETAKLFPSEFEDSEPGPIPKGWRIAEIRELCSSVENGGTPKREVAEYWQPGEIPWLTSGEVRQRFVTETVTKISRAGLENSSAKIWPRGTTVVAMYGATAGEVTLTALKLSTNQACCGLIPRETTRSLIYLSMLDGSSRVAGLARGSAQQNLSQGLVAGFRVVYPPEPITGAFETQVGGFLERAIANQLANRSLATVRDVLLPRLLSGELSVACAGRAASEIA